MANVTTVTAQYIADTTQYVRNVRNATTSTNQFAAALPNAGRAADAVSLKTVALGTAIGQLGVQLVNRATSGLKSFAVGSFMAAARVEELDTAMKAVGRSTGVGYLAIRNAALAIRDNGIEMGSAQRIATQFAQANLDMAKASEVARAAQDLAVIAGLNSTDTTDRLTQAIITGNSELLRTAGIAKTASMAYKTYAAENKLSVSNLSANQKQQAMMNMILAEGAKVAGTYEASMNSAGKVMRSFARITNDIAIEIGGIALKALGPLIIGLYKLYKAFSVSIREGGALRPVIDSLTATFSALAAPVLNLVKRMQEFAADPAKMQELNDKLMTMLNFLKAIVPIILAGVVAYKGFQIATAIMGALKSAIQASTIAQLMFNAASMANPIGAAIGLAIIALTGLAVAFKIVYDRSKPVRDAFEKLVATLKLIVSVVVGSVISAFKSFTGQTNAVAGKAKSFSDILNDFIQAVAPYVVNYINFMAEAFKVVGTYLVILIKYYQVLFTVLRMVAGIVKGVFVGAWNLAIKAFSWILDHTGFIGEQLKTFGKTVVDVFSNIGPMVVNAFKAVAGAIEPFINGAIDAINFLIDAYNLLPWVTDKVGRIDPFVMPDLSMDGFVASVDKYVGTVEKLKTWQQEGGMPQATKKLPKEDGPGGDGKGTDSALDAMKKKMDALKESLLGASAAYKNMVTASESRFGQPSEIAKALGSEGDISSAISMYDQLDSSLRDYYQSLMAIEKTAGNSKREAQLGKAMEKERGELTSAVNKQIKLYDERNRVAAALVKLEEEYGKEQTRINDTYDALDTAAEKATQAIEDHYSALIPQLEKALATATAAFDKENSVLQGMISERNSFLKNITDGFRSYANDLANTTKSVIKITQDLGNGITLTTDREVADASSFRNNLESRLTALREFGTNIRTLIARGLDPNLVRDFVAAGASSAGATVSGLVAGSLEDLTAINDLQSQLSTEIGSFTTYASAQFFDASIAQQEAIVAPLQLAAAQAQMALDTANASRDQELKAAKAYQQLLKDDRDAALLVAKTSYEENNRLLIALGEDINKKLQESADAVNAKFLTLSTTLPPQMKAIGRDAINGIIQGMGAREGALRAEAHRLAQAINDEFRGSLMIHSPSKVMKTVGEQVAAGLVQGMRESEGIVRSAASALASTIVIDPSLANISFDAAAYGGGGVGMTGGAGGPVTITNNYEVNVQSLAGDKRQIGREVVEAIRAFERTSGPVYQPADN